MVVRHLSSSRYLADSTPAAIGGCSARHATPPPPARSLHHPPTRYWHPLWEPSSAAGPLKQSTESKARAARKDQQSQQRQRFRLRPWPGTFVLCSLQTYPTAAHACWLGLAAHLDLDAEPLAQTPAQDGQFPTAQTAHTHIRTNGTNAAQDDIKQNA